jgi:hypothetical protein
MYPVYIILHFYSFEVILLTSREVNFIHCNFYSE